MGATSCSSSSGLNLAGVPTAEELGDFALSCAKPSGSSSKAATSHADTPFHRLFMGPLLRTSYLHAGPRPTPRRVQFPLLLRARPYGDRYALDVGHLDLRAPGEPFQQLRVPGFDLDQVPKRSP